MKPRLDRLARNILYCRDLSNAKLFDVTQDDHAPVVRW